ncbi:hypothetical protein PSHT_05140 [Puccinia striiformis]|uniref:CxC1-like cysteine cluster associated with KDZ transposases domain-containing protein n=1 Tax=Puccinia striiformis TaxID=27350 RepID=A0A2S4WB69_9BASI|nr:hypothetical protein PSHT_05140 [Puccinia striiformis]
MTFCGCIPNPIRLIYYGYVTALPLLPRTAFFIPTLQLYQSLWYESSEPYTSFVSGMMAHQDTRDREKLKACGGRDNSRELRLPFSQALNIFSRIHVLQSEILDKTLGLTTQDQWASICPLCFGPMCADERGSNEEQDTHLSMDGNFQQRHH